MLPIGSRAIFLDAIINGDYIYGSEENEVIVLPHHYHIVEISGKNIHATVMLPDALDRTRRDVETQSQKFGPLPKQSKKVFRGDREAVRKDTGHQGLFKEGII